MKKLFWFSICNVILMTIICFIGCDEASVEHKNATNVVNTNRSVQLCTIEYDSCEYVVATEENAIIEGVGVGVTHKGNCKYCKNK